jgi:Fur family ferric uptake transcriptional regulator
MEIEQHLKDHDLRVTDIRKKLYSYFVEAKSAVSHADLELIFSDEFDRVTIYRTLHSFLDKGILHKIPNDSGSARYALCHADCNPEHHIDNHIHFKCRVCERLMCLHDLKVPELKLPGNFSIESAALLYEGVCDKCS